MYFAIGNVLVSSRLSKLGFINTRWRKKDRRFNYIERLAAIRLGSLVPVNFGAVIYFGVATLCCCSVKSFAYWLVWHDLFPSLELSLPGMYLLELLPGVLSPWIVALCLSQWFVAWGLTSWIYAKNYPGIHPSQTTNI